MKNRKNGVAVIIVLGLLALMMVLGVAFSVSMRVERAGAGNYASAVNSSQLVWAGLARAVQAVNAATPGMYPDGDFLVSGQTVWDENGAELALVTGDVTNHVPGALLDIAQSARADWVQLGSDDGMGGQVAYLVLNLSDMLDANHVGGEPRGGGTNAAELVLDSIRIDSAAADLLAAERQSAGFESLHELAVRLPGLPTDGLVTFSRYLPDNNRTNAVDIGGTVDELLARQDEIVAAIQRVAASGQQEGLTPAQAEEVFYGLLDYIDTDSTLYNNNTMVPNAEAVPMLNEISPVQAAIVKDPPGKPGNFVFACQIGIETWYPYLKPSDHTFELSCEYSVSGVITQELTGIVTANPGVDVGLPSLNNKTIPVGQPFYVNTLAAALDLPYVALSSNHSFSVTISISNLVVKIADVPSQPIVDDVGNSVFTFSYSGSSGMALSLNPIAYQTIDPRFNWLKTYWISAPSLPIGGVMVTNAPTLYKPPANFNGTNIWTRAVLQTRQSSAAAIEFGPSFNVSNAGRLYSPLELGNLLRSPLPLAMFQSFRVFDQTNDTATITPRHQILENFTIKPVDYIERGLVNVNTIDTAILETAFRGMPHPYVGGATLGPVEYAAVANLIASAQASGTVFSNLTQVLELKWRSDPALAKLSDTELEAIAAYSTGLLGVRQNLFLILVTAAKAESGMGTRGDAKLVGATMARKSAMALVWRDPVPNKDASPLHDCFIQYFKWLD